MILPFPHAFPADATERAVPDAATARRMAQERAPQLAPTLARRHAVLSALAGEEAEATLARVDDAVFVAGMLANGHLLSYDGEGHTSYGRDQCVDDAIHAYLIDLTVPPEDPQCGGGGSVPAP